jgi:hypothetical protein
LQDGRTLIGWGSGVGSDLGGGGGADEHAHHDEAQSENQAHRNDSCFKTNPKNRLSACAEWAQDRVHNN